jgi:hypothetical protein
MTTIRVTCPGCGDLELSADELRLVVAEATDASFYSFRCRRCRLAVRRPASHGVVMLLMSGGVVAETLAVPAEALEARSGAPISYDDLLDFLLALEGTADPVAAAAPPVHA